MATPVPPGSPTTPNRRLRFPSDDAHLTKTYSAPRHFDEKADDPDTDADHNHDHNNAAAGEPDREPAAHHSVWQSIRDWGSALKKDFGSADRHDDVQDLMGDIGIDLHTIRRITKKGKGGPRIASLIGPSVMLARPGFGMRSESSSTVPTLGTTPMMGTTANASAPSSASPSGIATPLTPRKFGAGVDPHDVTHALRKLKERMGKKDSKQARYVQAKADIAHRRNLVLLMVSGLTLHTSLPITLSLYAFSVDTLQDRLPTFSPLRHAPAQSVLPR